MKSLLGVALIALALSGCASIPQEDIHLESAGQKPADAEKMAKDYFGPNLKDPFSAQYVVSDPIQCYMRKAPVSGGKISQYGWCTNVSINAKNSFGAYIGYQSHRLFYSYGSVSEYYGNMYFSESWLRE